MLGEQLGLADHRLAAGQAQFVDDRLEDHDRVVHAAGQRVDVVAQLQRGAEQRGVRRLALADAALQEVLHRRLHFIRQRREPRALDHRGGAAHLVQFDHGLLQR